MRKSLKCLLLLSLSFILWGCGNDDDEPNDPSSGEYYVKYEASITSSKIGTIYYTVNTDNGQTKISGGKSFSQTYGPVKKGFHASIKSNANNLYEVSMNEVKIYVCRGSEPFSLKASSSSRNKHASTSYTIDF